MWDTCRLAAIPPLAQNWATPNLSTGSTTAEVYVRASCSATADASVMAPSPFAVKLSVGAVGAVEAVGGGGALSQEGGAANCSPTVSQESAESSLASSLASPGASWGNPEGGLDLILPHASHALASGAVPATASGPFAHLPLAHETLGSSRDSLAWRCSS